MIRCLVYNHLLKYHIRDIMSCGRNNYSRQVLLLLKRRVKQIKTKYVNFKYCLGLFYKWIWVKKCDLFNVDEEC
jgi:hypothetical protein